jgi:hypothetical protein
MYCYTASPYRNATFTIRLAQGPCFTCRHQYPNSRLRQRSQMDQGVRGPGVYLRHTKFALWCNIYIWRTRSTLWCVVPFLVSLRFLTSLVQMSLNFYSVPLGVCAHNLFGVINNKKLTRTFSFLDRSASYILTYLLGSWTTNRPRHDRHHLLPSANVLRMASEGPHWQLMVHVQHHIFCHHRFMWALYEHTFEFTLIYRSSVRHRYLHSLPSRCRIFRVPEIPHHCYPLDSCQHLWGHHCHNGVGLVLGVWHLPTLRSPCQWLFVCQMKQKTGFHLTDDIVNRIIRRKVSPWRGSWVWN